jgi:hypothetical protein
MAGTGVMARPREFGELQVGADHRLGQESSQVSDDPQVQIAVP